MEAKLLVDFVRDQSFNLGLSALRHTPAMLFDAAFDREVVKPDFDKIIWQEILPRRVH